MPKHVQQQDLTNAINGITKSSLGLGNVDNTSDANKPISTAEQAALNGKANTTHTHVISDVSSLQTTLDSKQATLVSGTTIKTINGTSVLGSGDITLSGSTSDATTTAKGIVQLAGDLAGTASSPIYKGRSVVTIGGANTDYPVANYANIGAAVNAAFTALDAIGGGTAELDAGTWTMPNPGTLIVPKNRIRFRGKGVNATTIATARTDYIIKTNGTTLLEDFIVSDMTIDCQNATNVNGIQILYANRCKIERVYFKNNAKWMLKIGNEPSGSTGFRNSDCEVTYCTFDNHSSIYEMLLIYNSDDTVIRNCTFKNNAANSPTLGVWQQTRRTKIINTKFVDCVKSSIYYGITTHDNIIDKCEFINSPGLVGANVPDNGLMGETYISRLIVTNSRFIGGANTTTSAAVQYGAVDGCFASNVYVEGYERGFEFGFGNETTIGGSQVTAPFPSKNGTIANVTFKNINPSGLLPAIHNALVFKNGAGTGMTFANIVVNDDQSTPTNVNPISFNTAGATYSNIRFVGGSFPVASGGNSIKVNDSATVDSTVEFLLPSNTFTNPAGGIQGNSIKKFDKMYVRDGNLAVSSDTINANTNLQVGDGSSTIRMRFNNIQDVVSNDNLQHLFSGSFTGKKESWYKGTISAPNLKTEIDIDTGTVTVGDPTAPLHATTKKYTDGKVGYTKTIANSGGDATLASGGDLYTIFDSVVNTLTSGRTSVETILVRGVFSVSGPLTVPAYTRVVVDGTITTTTLRPGGGVSTNWVNNMGVFELGDRVSKPIINQAWVEFMSGSKIIGDYFNTNASSYPQDKTNSAAAGVTDTTIQNQKDVCAVHSYCTLIDSGTIGVTAENMHGAVRLETLGRTNGTPSKNNKIIKTSGKYVVVVVEAYTNGYQSDSLQVLNTHGDFSLDDIVAIVGADGGISGANGINRNVLVDGITGNKNGLRGSSFKLDGGSMVSGLGQVSDVVVKNVDVRTTQASLSGILASENVSYMVLMGNTSSRNILVDGVSASGNWRFGARTDISGIDYTFNNWYSESLHGIVLKSPNVPGDAQKVTLSNVSLVERNGATGETGSRGIAIMGGATAQGFQNITLRNVKSRYFEKPLAERGITGLGSDGTIQNVDYEIDIMNNAISDVDLVSTNRRVNIKKLGQIVQRDNGNVTLTNVVNPVSAQDAATKSYVDTADASKKQVMVQQPSQTTSFTAVAGRFYPVNASAGNVTVTLPTSTAGQEIQIKKLDANAATGATSGIVNITGTINGNASATVPIRKQGMGKQYLADGSGGWTIVLGDLDITQLGASTLEQGFIQLAGDLGGTAASPTVPGLATKEPTITAGTAAQYWRGDKSWQTLDKTAVGLGNVDNTSDINKPVSTAQQTAIDTKVAKSGDTMTGKLTLATNSTTVAPISFAGSGNNLNTTPAAGAVEFDNSFLYYTTSTAARQTVASLGQTQTLSNKTLSGATIADATDIIVGTTTGTKIGTATTQKIGFFGTTPAIQPVASTEIGTALASIGIRASGGTYAITTSGSAQLSGTTTLSGLAIISNAQKMAGVSRTTSTTVTSSMARYHEVDATSGAITMTLPVAASNAGLIYHFTKVDSSANTVTIKGNGTELINASNTQVLSSQYKYLEVRVNASNTAWLITGNN